MKLVSVRNTDLQDRHYYLVEVKSRNMTLLTLGKFDERALVFEYFNYYTNKGETVDVFNTKKLVEVFSIECAIRDIDYNRIFGK